MSRLPVSKNRFAAKLSPTRGMLTENAFPVNVILLHASGILAENAFPVNVILLHAIGAL